MNNGYSRDFDKLEQRRRRGMLLIAAGVPHAQVARRLGVSRQAVYNWSHALQTDDDAWRRKTLGRPRQGAVRH